jgi:hypothetical protein
MAFYKKKPVVVEAMQFDGSSTSKHAVYLWAEKHVGSFDFNFNADEDEVPKSGVSIDPATGCMVIATLEGIMTVSHGDYVICVIQGEFYPCKPDIFEATYEPYTVLSIEEGMEVYNDGV